MKRKNSFVLNEKNNKAVKLFTQLGMPKNTAKTVMYMSQTSECRSREIQEATHLRQPEVSLVMQELRKKGWVKKHATEKKWGKGRPVHVYKIAMDLSEILNNFEQEKIKEFENVKKDLTELKNLIGNR